VSSGRIKGAAFRELLIWYGSRFGASVLTARVLSVPPDDRREFDPYSPSVGVIPSAWYAAHTVHSLLDAVTAGTSQGEREQLAIEGSEAVMKATLSGVYRLIFKVMATPERYASHAPKLWSSYYDCGRFNVALRGRGAAICTIESWSSHHDFICLLNWGAASAIYRAIGCANVRTERTSCVDAGASCCRFVTRWDE